MMLNNNKKINKHQLDSMGKLYIVEIKKNNMLTLGNKKQEQKKSDF
jgi:hypothetical protein